MLEQSVAAGEMSPVINPAEPKDIVGYVREATPREVEQALESAVNNAPIWFATPPAERAAILHRAAVLMESQMQQLIGILVREAGKTFSNAIDVYKRQSLQPVVVSGSLPDAHHKTAVSHCVHPVKASPAHFAFFVHERPDNFPPAPAHQSLSVNVGVTVHSRLFHLHTA